MKKLYLFGAGSGTREVLLLVERINAIKSEWDVLGFVDEDPNLIGTEVDELPVFGPDEIEVSKDTFGVCGIMDSIVRQRMIEDIAEDFLDGDSGMGLKDLEAWVRDLMACDINNQTPSNIDPDTIHDAAVQDYWDVVKSRQLRNAIQQVDVWANYLYD